MNTEIQPRFDRAVAASRISRRLRPLSFGSFVVCAAFGALTARAEVGKRFPSEKRVIEDPVTGVTLTALTAGPSVDIKIYQTHPQWTADGRHIVFRSSRAGKPQQAFAVHEDSGAIVQLTAGSDTVAESLNLSRKANLLYFLRTAAGAPLKLVELRLDSLFRDSEAGAMKAAEAYERTVATLPQGLEVSGGFALDAEETHAYLGAKHAGRSDAGRLWSIDLRTGVIEHLVDAPFRVGHVQANPRVPGEILYCHETGGDAPQRMWLVNTADRTPRPLYPESPEEAVTHEVFAGPDHVLFILSGLLPRSRTKPTGIAWVHLRTGEAQLHGQVKVTDGRFWHCAATPDLRWIIGDTPGGALYVIDASTGERQRLTQGHRRHDGAPHAHQNISRDGKRVLFNSGMLGGAHLMTIELTQALHELEQDEQYGQYSVPGLFRNR